MKNTTLINNYWENLSSQSGIISFILCFIFGINPNSQAQAQEELDSEPMDSSKIKALYLQIVKKTKCTNDLTPSAFYALLRSYSYPQNTHSHSHSYSNNTSSATPTTTSNQPDTVYITRVDTLKMEAPEVASDTVFMYQDLPNQAEVKTAQTALQKVMEDQDLKNLIQEVVKDMSSEEIRKFRKEIQDNVKDMSQLAKKEQAQRVVQELEAKRTRLKFEKEARIAAKKERKEAWDTMSKAEKKELIKAKVALIAEEAGTALKNGAMATGAVVGGSLAVVGGIVALGIIAIGKGIIKVVSAIWNWINDHFYIKIDLSCAQQRKIKKRMQYTKVINKHKRAIPYKGHCPSWQ